MTRKMKLGGLKEGGKFLGFLKMALACWGFSEPRPPVQLAGHCRLLFGLFTNCAMSKNPTPDLLNVPIFGLGQAMNIEFSPLRSKSGLEPHHQHSFLHHLATGRSEKPRSRPLPKTTRIPRSSIG